MLENYWLQPAARRAPAERPPLPARRPSARDEDLRTAAPSPPCATSVDPTTEGRGARRGEGPHPRDDTTRHCVTDGEFYKVAFDYNRDVAPLIEEVKVATEGRGGGANEDAHRGRAGVRSRRPRDPEPQEESYRRLLQVCTELYAPVLERSSLDDRLSSLGDIKTQMKTWLNFARPFIMLDTVDSAKYGFSEEHHAARFIALPHIYRASRVSRSSTAARYARSAECDKYDACLKREMLEALPRGTAVGHMAGRHEMHFLSLYHGFSAAASSTSSATPRASTAITCWATRRSTCWDRPRSTTSASRCPTRPSSA